MSKMTQREYDVLMDALHANERALEDARAGKRLAHFIDRLETRVAVLRAHAAEAIIVDESEVDRREVEVIPTKIGL